MPRMTILSPAGVKPRERSDEVMVFETPRFFVVRPHQSRKSVRQYGAAEIKPQRCSNPTSSPCR
jgi:hypothetical protein